MAFSPNLALCQSDNCANIVFTDTSTDWHLSLIPIGDANAYVTVVIEDNAGNTQTYDVSDVFHAATVQADLEYDSEDYSGGPYPDGFYTVTYNFYTSTAATTPTYTVSIDKFFTCFIDCCIDKMVLSIRDKYECDNCDDDYIIHVLMLDGIRRSLKLKAALCDYVNAQKDLDLLEELCDWQNCNCNKT